MDCNLTHPDLFPLAEQHARRAMDVGVTGFLVPGTLLSDSIQALELAQRMNGRGFKVHTTMGVHPYTVAQQETTMPVSQFVDEIRKFSFSAIGECGLDYSDGFPDRDIQLRWFQPQVALACELQRPLFLHERLAHADFLNVLSRFQGRLPPVLVHCFTGTVAELDAYVKLGFFISFSGLICREGSSSLRAACMNVPLDKVMIETDAPYLGFKGCNPQLKRSKVYPNVPCSLPVVLDSLATAMGVPIDILAAAVTRNAHTFLGK